MRFISYFPYFLKKNPLICSNSVVKFEQLLGSKNRFISNWQLVVVTNFKELIEWYKKFTAFVGKNELKLYSQQIRWALSLYNFYLLLHNSHVVITRFKKQEGKGTLLPSSYIKRLQILLDLFQNSNYVDDIVNRITPVYRPRVCH